MSPIDDKWRLFAQIPQPAVANRAFGSPQALSIRDGIATLGATG